MDQALVDVFEQARKLVADADRKVAEEEERRKESEREKLVLELGLRVEEAFDFTSKEKLELEPRLDVHDGAAVVEFVVRSVRAIFLLSPNEGDTWTLQVVEDGHKPQILCEFQGGAKNGTGVPTSGSGAHRDDGGQLGAEGQGASGGSERNTTTEMATA